MTEEECKLIAEAHGWQHDEWADHTLGQIPWIDVNENVMIFEGSLTDEGAFRMLVEAEIMVDPFMKTGFFYIGSHEQGDLYDDPHEGVAQARLAQLK